MKTFLSWLLLISLTVLQVIVSQSFGFAFAVPLSAIVLIVFSLFIGIEQLLYMALVAGLILDLAGGSEFGLNISFLIFAVVFCKIIMRFGKRDIGLPLLVLLSCLLVVFYEFLKFVTVFSSDQLQGLSAYLSQTGLQIVATIGWTIILYYISLQGSRLQFSLQNKRFFKFNRFKL
ncbi:MAG: hypothetical protein QG675_494 [Patescibacteria group bacterium]|nr:hypothetical protein [Patescibacteria group bacterium]